MAIRTKGEEITLLRGLLQRWRDLPPDPQYPEDGRDQAVFDAWQATVGELLVETDAVLAAKSDSST